jgi:hypothetical protein
LNTEIGETAPKPLNPVQQSQTAAERIFERLERDGHWQ